MIVVRMRGGLGNHLFQYAMTRRSAFGDCGNPGLSSLRMAGACRAKYRSLC